MTSFYMMGAEELAAKFQAAIVQLQAEKPSWLAEGGEIVKTSVQGVIESENLIRTGALLRSGRVFGATADNIFVGFGQGLDYAAALELGAMPHSIDASAAPVLQFWWEKMGLWFVGPHVNHPGNRPYAFMRNGAELALTPLALMFLGRLRAIFGVGL